MHGDGRLVNSLRLRSSQLGTYSVFKHTLDSAQFSLIRRTNGQSLGTFQKGVFFRKSMYKNVLRLLNLPIIE